MNGTASETEELISGLVSSSADKEAAEVIICPPFTAIALASRLLESSSIAVGGQNMSEHEKGAYTGEISVSMLLTAGASYVILGHSERRQYYAETDQLVNQKAKLAFSFELTPIICVGETLAQREAEETEKVIIAQLDGATDGFTAEELSRSVIAYEPVWAIGTGRTATPEMAEDAHRLIRKRLSEKIDTAAAGSLPILYGGSVKPENAKELMAQEDIDGALVGGASLNADDFVKIIQAV